MIKIRLYQWQWCFITLQIRKLRWMTLLYDAFLCVAFIALVDSSRYRSLPLQLGRQLFTRRKRVILRSAILFFVSRLLADRSHYRSKASPSIAPCGFQLPWGGVCSTSAKAWSWRSSRNFSSLAVQTSIGSSDSIDYSCCLSYYIAVICCWNSSFG